MLVITRGYTIALLGPNGPVGPASTVPLPPRTATWRRIAASTCPLSQALSHWIHPRAWRSCCGRWVTWHVTTASIHHDVRHDVRHERWRWWIKKTHTKKKTPANDHAYITYIQSYSSILSIFLFGRKCDSPSDSWGVSTNSQDFKVSWPWLWQPWHGIFRCAGCEGKAWPTRCARLGGVSL